MNEPKDLYHVAVKLLIRNGDELLITHDVFGSWDIPGGRIKPDEFETSLEDIINRKVKEELGTEFKFELGKSVVFFRHKRIENTTGNEFRIFAVGYEAKYQGGEISLGTNHDQLKWVNLESFRPEEYFEGGWLKGIQEYLLLVNN